MQFKRLIYIGLVFALFSCKKGKDKYPDTDLGGHACAGLNASNSLFHDNSKEAFEYALSFSEIEAIEIDVRISKDTTPWLFHDDLLNHETSGTGCIAERNDTYLSNLHYSGLKHEKLARINDLPQDLQGKKLVVDFRELSGCDALPQDSLVLIKGLLKLRDHFKNTSISILCNSARFLGVFHSWGWQKILYSYNYSHFSSYPTSIPFDGVCWSNDDCSSSDVQMVKEQGKSVILFSVRSPKTIRKALKKHPSILLVDNLKEGINEKFR